MSPDFGKILMVLGGVAFLLGMAAYFGWLSWLGKMPGDISIRKGNFSFYFPVVTCILVSMVLTLVMRFFKK